MKLSDIHALEIGRLLVRRYPLREWSAGFEIRRRIFSANLIRWRVEMFWCAPAGAKDATP